MISINEEEEVVKSIVYVNTIEYLMFKDIVVDTILIMYKERFDYEFNKYCETYPEEIKIEVSELPRLLISLGFDYDTQFENIKNKVLNIQKGCSIKHDLLQKNKYILYLYFKGNYVPTTLFEPRSTINIISPPNLSILEDTKR